MKVDGKTLPDCYFKRVRLTPQLYVCKKKVNSEFVGITFETFHRRVLALYDFYEDLKIKKGDTIALFCHSRPEWLEIDYTNLCAGLVTVPIYSSSTEEDIAFILKDSKPKLLFVESQELYQKIEKTLSQFPEKKVFIEGGKKDESYQGIVGRRYPEERHKQLEQKAIALLPEDTASIVYTSGTTGLPKGAVLTHGNFVSEIRNVCTEVDVESTDSTLTFLPFAHILGRVESSLPIMAGVCLNFAENVASVAQDLALARPTILVSVPRIYEKIYAKIQGEIQGSEVKKALFHWAVGIGKEVARHREKKEPLSVFLQLKHKVADELVLSKVRAKLGGNLRFTISGGAPLSAELCEFFHGVGVQILEGYGLTETTAAICLNHPKDFCFGTVGRPLKDCELRVAEDGEVLVRGPYVFKEYHNNKEATRDVFVEGGWFRTGDIGEITERGFLRITDRKKEIIVTSGGKNIAPQKLENLLKQSSIISQAMIYGDREKYLVALLTLQNQIAKNIDETVRNLVQKEIDAMNSKLASFETVKKFAILEKDFSVEAGELTPSLKLKRRVISKKYGHILKNLYQLEEGQSCIVA